MCSLLSVSLESKHEAEQGGQCKDLSSTGQERPGRQALKRNNRVFLTILQRTQASILTQWTARVLELKAREHAVTHQRRTTLKR